MTNQLAVLAWESLIEIIGPDGSKDRGVSLSRIERGPESTRWQSRVSDLNLWGQGRTPEEAIGDLWRQVQRDSIRKIRAAMEEAGG